MNLVHKNLKVSYLEDEKYNFPYIYTYSLDFYKFHFPFYFLILFPFSCFLFFGGWGTGLTTSRRLSGGSIQKRNSGRSLEDGVT